MSKRFGAKDFVAAMPGTGGVVAALARSVGCCWHTAAKWCASNPTVKRAWEAETQSALDLAESVLIGNIRLASEVQERDKHQVDASDAKWLLAKRGKHRGYGDVTTVEHAAPVTLTVEYGENHTTERQTR